MSCRVITICYRFNLISMPLTRIHTAATHARIHAGTRTHTDTHAHLCTHSRSRPKQLGLHGPNAVCPKSNRLPNLLLKNALGSCEICGPFPGIIKHIRLLFRYLNKLTN